MRIQPGFPTGYFARGEGGGKLFGKANVLLGKSGGIPPQEKFYKATALRLNLVGFGSLTDYPKCVFKLALYPGLPSQL